MIADLLKAAVLGVLQGITEFLPVSSTGHLVLAERAMGVDEDRYGLAFDAALHLGTLLALLAYFGGRWWRLFLAGVEAWLRWSREQRARLSAGQGARLSRAPTADGAYNHDQLEARARLSRAPTAASPMATDPAAAATVAGGADDGEGRLAWLIVLGTLPAGAVGLAFGGEIEDAFRSPWLVAVMLIAFSAVFVIAEARGRGDRPMGLLDWRDALFIGVAQAVALVPGVSRSGATISAGLLRGYRRPEAATFAFLLSAPVIAAVAVLEGAGTVRRFADGRLGGEDAAFFATGLVMAAIVGYWSISFLLRFLVTNSLVPFAWYRVALGSVVLIVLGVQAAS